MIEQLQMILQQIEHQWPSKRLLVVGDVMLDKYIWGRAGRISPEAPVPVVLASLSDARPGGAANVAMNVAGLGAQVVVAGFAGCDEDERLLESLLDRRGVGHLLVGCEAFPTISKTRILCGQHQMLRLDSERLDRHPDADYERLLAAVLEEIPKCDAVILSDYAKGVITASLCERVVAEARERGVPVLVDPKNPDLGRYRGATTICPNLKELVAAIGVHAPAADTTGLEATLNAAQAIVADLGIDFLTATLSEKGIALIRKDGHTMAPAVARQVFDVSGAGDTVIATLALALASGLTAEQGVQLANLAAGIVVGKVGTVQVEKHELLAALTPEIALHAEEKVVSREELRSRIAYWRTNGDKVVFTNGCFDLLHVGHITLLEQARSFGSKLIVAINSDASVQRLKGPTRPIVGECDRARILAALTSVDAVIVFDEPTPLEAIEYLRPDVLVKGGDYNAETVVGAQQVLSWGGQVKIVPTVVGFSTTNLIAKGGARSA